MMYTSMMTILAGLPKRGLAHECMRHSTGVQVLIDANNFVILSRHRQAKDEC